MPQLQENQPLFKGTPYIIKGKLTPSHGFVHFTLLRQIYLVKSLLVPTKPLCETLSVVTNNSLAIIPAERALNLEQL